jgi:hypothetical protein
MREGKHWGLVKSAVNTKSSRKGTPELAITVLVTHELDVANGEWVPIANVEKVIHLYLSDAAIDYSIEKLERLGFNGRFDAPQFSDEVTKDPGVGLYMKLEPDEKGRSRENWDFSNVNVPEALPAEESLQLNARYKAKTAKPTTNKPAGKPASPGGKKPTAPAATQSAPSAEQPVGPDGQPTVF